MCRKKGMRLKSPLQICCVPLRLFIYLFTYFLQAAGFSSPHHTDEAANEYHPQYHYSLVWLELIETLIKATAIDSFTNSTTLALPY